MLGEKYNSADDICLDIANDLYKFKQIAIVVTDGLNIQFDRELKLHGIGIIPLTFMSNLTKLRFTIAELDFMYKRNGMCTICDDGRIKGFEIENPTARTAGKY